ncbi:ankyrin repeat domain-containing protein [Paenibacillus sp. H1-7]|uniref:ankyrin repeat domain-containing protein n=1 Tax=Paenibacillus sp. H1-7 TaxID=2282849 RepID=UPI001EF81A46|nr:ankyrin repeat domain-containing protein [Paenibacillus sp. H1-7]ULL16303.1 ankyrin repeat domain-containing protein [Paenibacillus sp. H1-7]
MPKKKNSVVISTRLDDQSLKAVDLLVESGLETNRSRAVSHLVAKGIQASEDLLRKAQALADHVQQLRNEMFEAISHNNVEKVTELLRQDSSLVNVSNSKGETAVLIATYLRANEIKELLIEQGAELNIFEASAVGNTARVKELLEQTPHWISAYGPDGFPPLSMAAHFDNEETVKLLLELGADVNARSQDGNLNNMAVHAAIMGNYEHIIQLLIRYGADVNARCEGKLRAGYTALHVASYFGRESLIELFLKHGADKSVWNADGETPYELALNKGHLLSAELLK